jgi:signal recognition particle receptor subunit beta
MLSLATDQDVTLFFDFLPIELGDVMGFKVRLHLFTVPGQVYYGATRRAVLMGADGVIFVADSQSERLEDNLLSIRELEDNVRHHGKKLETIPFLIQYNKRDLLNILPVEELNAKINPFGVPYFESVATEGKGVFESLTMISRMVLKVIKDGAEARESAAIAFTPSEAKVTDALRVERRIPRAEYPRPNQEGPAPRPVSSPEKDTPPPEPSLPGQNAAPTRKLELEKPIPQVETPRAAGIPSTASAKTEGETSHTGGRSIINRLFSQKTPEPPGQEYDGHKEALLTSKPKNRILSFGEPRISSSNHLEIPLTLGTDGPGKKRSFVIAIKLEELEP